MSADSKLESISAVVPYPLQVNLKSVVEFTKAHYVSGQIATRQGELISYGLVGREVNLEIAQECARQCAINVLSVLRTHIGSLDKVKQVCRVAVYVASDDNFTDQHLVAHGASQVFTEVFGDNIGRHARTAIGVKTLPLNSPVEVDTIFEL